MAEDIWQGERTEPNRLADQIAGAPSKTLRLPGVEALEIVSLRCSVANRDLIVEALRRFGLHS